MSKENRPAEQTPITFVGLPGWLRPKMSYLHRHLPDLHISPKRKRVEFSREGCTVFITYELAAEFSGPQLLALIKDRLLPREEKEKNE